MWTIPGLLGLVLMLLASAEANSRLQQYITSDTALRQGFNNTEQLQEVNTGNYSLKHITIASKIIILNILILMIYFFAYFTGRGKPSWT